MPGAPSSGHRRFCGRLSLQCHDGDLEEVALRRSLLGSSKFLLSVRVSCRCGWRVWRRWPRLVPQVRGYRVDVDLAQGAHIAADHSFAYKRQEQSRSTFCSSARWKEQLGWVPLLPVTEIPQGWSSKFLTHGGVVSLGGWVGGEILSEGNSAHRAPPNLSGDVSTISRRDLERLGGCR